MEQIVEQGMLYDFYGSLLTGHQQEIYEMVVYRNLSLNEIAEQKGISKQAVSDLIRRATAQMRWYEERLGLMERFRRIRRRCDALVELTESVESAEWSGTAGNTAGPANAAGNMTESADTAGNMTEPTDAAGNATKSAGAGKTASEEAVLHRIRELAESIRQDL